MTKLDDEAWNESTSGPLNTDGPHSRGCGYISHPHGVLCSPNCPTCGGKKPESTERFKILGNFRTAVDLPAEARYKLMVYINKQMEKTDGLQISDEHIYVVWFVKVLQNWKGLFSTTLPDGMYYELTFNGDKGELYIDAYKKWDNVTVKL